MFLLCRSCGQEKRQTSCTHTSEERSFIGTWVMNELRKAIELGYQVLEVYEMWEFDIITYKPTTGEMGLLTELMDQFLKGKQEASGYPSHCTTEESKKAYIDEFLERELIKLDPDKINYNIGYRAFCKNVLVSSWGKFGQRCNLPLCIITKEISVLYEYLDNPKIEVMGVLPLDDENIAINYKKIEEEVETLSTVNVVIAAYTTTSARLKLYDVLQPLGSRVKYMDTDSVIYSAKEGEINPSLGDCVGDLTDELVSYGPGAYITEIVIPGLKNYAFVVRNDAGEEHTSVKVKGIRLNHSINQKINFDSIKKVVLENPAGFTINFDSITRNKNFVVTTTPMTKQYRETLDKRVYLGKDTSLPYGHEDI